MSVDKPVRPASEVAREWWLTMPEGRAMIVAGLTALLEARDAEVRAEAMRPASEVADTERAQRFIRDHKIEAPNKLTDEWLTSRLAAVFAEVRAAALEEAAVAADTAVLGESHYLFSDIKSLPQMMQKLGLEMRKACARDIRALATRSTEER